MKLNFQEKVLKYVKKTKRATNKHVIYTTIILLILLYSFMGMAKILDGKSTIQHSENKKTKLTATFVGDIMLGRHVENVIDRYSVNYLFRHVEPYFTASNYATGNFEQPITFTDNHERADKQIHFSTRPQVVSDLKNIGFSVLNLANNHTMDYLDEGFNDTVKAFTDAKAGFVGMGSNLEDLQAIHYKNVNGITIATLGFTDIFTRQVSSTKPGPIPMDPGIFIPLIMEAKSNADLVFVHAHWGVEHDSGVSKRQKGLAQAMSDAGADVIIGHHPHVLSSFDIYNDTVIFYSLGNFIFDQGWSRTKDSALVQYKLTYDGIGLFEITPLRIKEASPTPTNSFYYKTRAMNTLTKHTSKSVDWKKKGSKILLSVDHSHLLKDE